MLIAGGINEDGDVLRSAEIYEPLTKQFHDTGYIFFARLSANGDFLDDGRVLITNGFNHHLYKKAEPFPQVNVFPQNIQHVMQHEIHDPISETFSVQ